MQTASSMILSSNLQHSMFSLSNKILKSIVIYAKKKKIPED